MASSRALVSGARCLNCHRQVLQSFITSFSAVTTSHQAQSRQALVPRRAFASSRSTRSDSKPSTRNPFEDDSIEADATLNSAPTYDSLKPKGKTSSGAAKQESSTSSEDVAEDEDSPWYLSPAAQETIDAPSSSFVNPLLERQRLPPLPPSPPPILSPLLNHLSIETGLDYLSLLDLRLMDPPPALGANLFMIFGTARSEKHLNVASDRLCRWLRSTYKLRPFADGLLGRNELKLKLKRKNRRMRMLGAAGISSTQGMDYEDGIGTGWVCVNVGSVEGGSLTDGAVSEVDEADIEGFVGFGDDAANTSRIVVQMMTEERRGEIDLEALWTQALERSLKAQSRQEKVEIDPGQSGRVFGQRRQLGLAENRAAV